MILMLVLGLALLALGVTFVLRAGFAGGAQRAGTIEQIGSYGFVPGGANPLDAPADGGIGSLVTAIGGALSRRLSSFSETEVRRELVSAGLYNVEPKTFLGYQVVAAVLLPTGLGMLLLLGGSSILRLMLFVAAAALAGWIGPRFVVRRRGRTRLDEIDYRLPELIDLLVVTIEAGLGFLGSLKVAAQRLDGPLGQELRLTLQEQSMGLSPTEALKNMLERADTPGMRTFVRSVVQGETLGVSMGQIMRNLAKEMRLRRKQAAEERAQKAPVKILFPLIFLIFPSMFVVLLGPAGFSLMRTLGAD